MMTTVDGFPIQVSDTGPDKGSVVVLLGAAQRAPTAYDAVCDRLHTASLRTIVLGPEPRLTPKSVVGILENRGSDANINVIAMIGILVFGIGSYFEWLADGQLQAFLANKENNKNRYLSTGVWTHTRHPNYFGNTCVWWGIWLVAISGNFESTWWTAAGPLVNTIMLTSVLGSTFADNRLGKRPEYQLLMARTRRFLPIPLPRNKVQEQERMVRERPIS